MELFLIALPEKRVNVARQTYAEMMVVIILKTSVRLLPLMTGQRHRSFNIHLHHILMRVRRERF